MNQYVPRIPVERIEQAILLIRGQKVMLDADLAKLYATTTKRLNEQVKRNRDRFSGRLHVPTDQGRMGFFEVANCDLKNW